MLLMVAVEHQEIVGEGFGHDGHGGAKLWRRTMRLDFIGPHELPDILLLAVHDLHPSPDPLCDGKRIGEILVEHGLREVIHCLHRQNCCAIFWAPLFQ